MSFETGQTIKVLKGKFKGQTAEVIGEKADPSGLIRVQVKLAGQIFSYLPKNVSSVTTVSEAKTKASDGATKPATDSTTTKA